MTVKLCDVKAGDTLIADDIFSCVKAGPLSIEENEKGLFFECDGGEELREPTCHYLDGQLAADGTLIGLSK